MSSQKLLTDKSDTPLNTACLVAAAKGTAAFVSIFIHPPSRISLLILILRLQPIACAPCVAQFGVTDPGNKSQRPTNGATGSAAAPNGGHSTIATPAANNIGQAVGPRATCDIKGASYSALIFFRASLQFLTACVINLEPTFPLCAPAARQLGAGAS
jgi:hypothetical protein